MTWLHHIIQNIFHSCTLCMCVCIHTCTSWISTTFPWSKSMMLYEPYFALCPGLSALPSPPRHSGTRFFWASAISADCSFSHTLDTAGSKKCDWCRKKVLCEIVGTDRNSSTRSTCVGDAPAKKMQADRNKFPAGVACFLMSGWLFQMRKCPHEGHSCLMESKVPTFFVSTVHGHKHFAHALKSSISAEKNTKNLAAFIVPTFGVYLHLR